MFVITKESWAYHSIGSPIVTAQIISIGLRTWVSPVYRAPYAVIRSRFFRNHKHTQQLSPIYQEFQCTFVPPQLHILWQWNEEMPRMVLQYMFKWPTTASTGKAPQSKEEPNSSGWGELWKPSRSGKPPWTWTWSVPSSYPWSETPSSTHSPYPTLSLICLLVFSVLSPCL